MARFKLIVALREFTSDPRVGVQVGITTSPKRYPVPGVGVLETVDALATNEEGVAEFDLASLPGLTYIVETGSGSPVAISGDREDGVVVRLDSDISPTPSPILPTDAATLRAEVLALIEAIGDGAQGDKGDKGDPGEQGPAGADGTGASAGVSVDHGAIDAALTITQPGSHEFDITVDAAITIDTDGDVSLRVHGTGAVTVAGTAFDVENDAVIVVVTWPRGEQTAYAVGESAGESEPEPVIESPTQPGTATLNPTSNSIVVTVVPSTVAAGYEWQIDGGPWVDGGAAPSYEYPSLTAGSSHSGAVRAYNSQGERSTVRTWGPASTDALGLHEQILSHDPSYYLRLSRGGVEDFSANPKVWTPTSGGSTAPVFDGPALAPGDVSSARWPTGSQLSTSGIDFGGMDSFTLVALVRSPDVAPGAYGNMGMANVNIGWDFESYSRYKPNETHIVFVEWDVSYGGNGRFYFDTDAEFSNANISRNGTTTADMATLYAHGNEFGAGSNGGFASYLAIIPNVLLDASQRLAMATAAGRA